MVKPEPLAYTLEFEGLPERGHIPTETITVEALPGGLSRLKSVMTYPTLEDLEGMLASGMESGAVESQVTKVLEAIGDGERSVNEIAALLDWPQPLISKHLGVLKKVGLVSERRVGRYRLYRVNAERLKPIQDWIKYFESMWVESFDRLDEHIKNIQVKED